MLEVVLSIFADAVIVRNFMLPQFNAPCREWPHWIRCRLHSRADLLDQCCSTCVRLFYWQLLQPKTVYDEDEIGVPFDACMSVKLGLSQQGKHRLAVFNNRVLRKIRVFGRKREEVTGGWRRASWFVLNTLLGRLYQGEGDGWDMWHMCGRREMHTGGFWKLEGKRPLGGSRY